MSGPNPTSLFPNMGHLSMDDDNNNKALSIARYRYRETQAAQIAAAGIEPDLGLVKNTINGLRTSLPRALTGMPATPPRRNGSGGSESESGGQNGTASNKNNNNSPRAHRAAKRFKFDDDGDAPRAGHLHHDDGDGDGDGDVMMMAPLSPVSEHGIAPAQQQQQQQQLNSPVYSSLDIAVAMMRGVSAVPRAVPKPGTPAARLHSLAMNMADAIKKMEEHGLAEMNGDDSLDFYLFGRVDDDNDNDAATASATATVATTATAAASASDRAENYGSDFNLLAALCTCPDVLIETFRYLRPGDIVIVYSTSRDVHEMLDINMQMCIMAWSRSMAPHASRVFSGPLYFQWLIRDPLESGSSSAREASETKDVTNGDDYDDDDAEKENKGENNAAATVVAATAASERNVPGLIWLAMVEQRQLRTQDIIACLARRGHRLPPGAIVVLMKIWLLMDMSSNAMRMRLMSELRLMTDSELVVAQLFMVKLLLCFNDPVYGPGSSSVVETFMGQRRGLAPLWALLRRKKYRTGLEITRLCVRYNVGPSPEQLAAGLPVLGVPVCEMGRGHTEGWGVGAKHLLRPDELVVIESVRRGIHSDAHLEAMMAYGHVDFATGRSLVPSLDEMYMDDVYLTSLDRARNENQGHESIFRVHKLLNEDDDEENDIDIDGVVAVVDQDQQDSSVISAAAAIANAGCGNVPFYRGEWEPRHAKKARWKTLDEREREAILAVDAAEKVVYDRLEAGKEGTDGTNAYALPPDLAAPFGNMAKNFSLAAALRDLSLDPLTPGGGGGQLTESSDGEEDGAADEMVMTDLGGVRLSELDDGKWFIDATTPRGGFARNNDETGGSDQDDSDDDDDDDDDDRSSVGSGRSAGSLDTIFDLSADRSVQPASRSSSGAYTVSTSLDMDDDITIATQADADDFLATQADDDYSDDELDFDWDAYAGGIQVQVDGSSGAAAAADSDEDEHFFLIGGDDHIDDGDDDSEDGNDGESDDDEECVGTDGDVEMNVDGEGSGEAQAGDAGAGSEGGRIVPSVEGPKEHLRYWYCKF